MFSKKQHLNLSGIKEELQKEYKNYQQAFAEDKEFYIIKSIRLRIKALENQLVENGLKLEGKKNLF